ncbi:uncharacterized protein PHACADRAFT_131825 [Phanerochaete carnosa HHB-10118-sp]|uniref:Protein kinase domain-containing protein n=1 Tax=Phanerochaete carnosa (strain HHB-10118-sp) TaxID=650164 RepID=K5VRF4_PHACS|nr:uncharacterized protein PHACADRAFT_131825 [Phanerochaete carnosa HHB-10118-sp]EKM49305.1 hypothetical protein PHACADRAFT_131825 [Phanerochaete carnosa HHB-10118-sp]
MERDFRKSDLAGRDALRRLMTHLAQKSGRLPESFLLSHVSKYAPSGSTPEPVAGGSFAEVYRGFVEEKGEKKLVALKALRILGNTYNIQQRKKQMYLEVLTCRQLQHRNVLRILGVSRDLDSFCIITPWVANGNVHDYLEVVSSRHVGAPTWLLNRWINHIANGMAYLHAEGVVHGDLRGVNILVDGEENAQIGDFGLATFIHGHSRNYESLRTGNFQWQAPEIMLAEGSDSTRITPASDVYSFSHVCIELYSGQPSPYPDRANATNGVGLMRFAEEITRAKNPKRPLHPKHIPDELWGLLQKCWHADPSGRPSSKRVVSSVASLSQRTPSRK